ncbi:MAG: preprotein translocase subunit SecG [Dysgonamonadaceae bacterium]|jgi:preprotein translocase subunit SecG|nr:preprotein translocase subunit SecG [Dysgonamonadaceae bacterium]
MYVFISVLIVIAALLLIFIVVIQNSKGGGLAAGFSSSNQVMGVRKTTDFLEKATWSLAGSVVVLAIVASFFVPGRNSKGAESEIKNNIENAVPSADPNAVSPFGTAVPEGTEPVPAQQTPTQTPQQQQETPEK